MANKAGVKVTKVTTRRKTTTSKKKRGNPNKCPNCGKFTSV